MFLIDTFDSRSTVIRERTHNKAPPAKSQRNPLPDFSKNSKPQLLHFVSSSPFFFHRKTDNNHDRMNYLAAVKKRKETDKTEETKQD